MVTKQVTVKISLCKETYGTYITGQQLVLAKWKSGKNAGLWELLPVGTTVDEARAYIQKWANEVGVTIIKETVF